MLKTVAERVVKVLGRGGLPSLTPLGIALVSLGFDVANGVSPDVEGLSLNPSGFTLWVTGGAVAAMEALASFIDVSHAARNVWHQVKPTRAFPVIAIVAAVSTLLLLAALGYGGFIRRDGGGSRIASGGGRDGSDRQGAPDDVPDGGEIVDVASFATGPPEAIDPALNTTVDAYQVVNQLYDGLTDVDYHDPDAPRPVGAVAASWDVSDDATEYTFTIRDGLRFSNGERVLPSSFVRGWERASDPDFAGSYSYLFNFLEGGAEKLAGTAPTIAGVEADDGAMTLTTRLSEPYADWPYVVGFQTFSPMPSAVDQLDDQAEWQNGLMIGNGPFELERPRSDTQVTLVPNLEWNGTRYDEALGLPEQPHLDRIVFRPVRSRETGYNAFEAGEADIGPIPDGQFGDAFEKHGTLDLDVLGTYYYALRWDDPVIGGPENRLLRQAISLAIDREDITETVWDGVFPVSTGITPPGVPGFEEGLCEHCSYDPEAAEEALRRWLDAGHELPDEPLKVRYNEGSYHENVTAIIVDNLADIGIEAVADPMSGETYFGDLAEGACQPVCRAGWFGDYPTYDNFLYDPFSTDSIDGNNHGRYSSAAFDELVARGKRTLDDEEQAELYRRAEEQLLNEDIAVIPLAWYGTDVVYDQDEVVGFAQTPLGLIRYEVMGVRR
jgi:oligopeptide transport system substrate-binding protein